MTDTFRLDEIDYKLRKLSKQKLKAAENADIAYKYRDFKLEDKYQREIDECSDKIAVLVQERETITGDQFTNLDIEAKISEYRAQHVWDGDGDIRCHNCQMKRDTTFSWKTDGVRENWKADFKREAVSILESMKCSP